MEHKSTQDGTKVEGNTKDESSTLNDPDFQKVHKTGGKTVRLRIRRARSPSPEEETTKKHRGYMITINHFTEEEEKKLLGEDYRYLVYQIEKGENEVEHIQAFIYYENPRAWPKKRFPRAHIEVARNLLKSAEYCKKEETRVRGPYEFGKAPNQGCRTDLDEIAQALTEKDPEKKTSLEEIRRSQPGLYVRYFRGLKALEEDSLPERDRSEAPEVIWLWGNSESGKSRWVRDTYGDKNVYVKKNGRWFSDRYKQQQVCLLEDFDGEWIPGTKDKGFKDLLCFLDRYPYEVDIKGSMRPFNSPIIVITCDKKPFDDRMFGTLHQSDKDQLERRISSIIRKDRPEGVSIRKPKEFIIDASGVMRPDDKPELPGSGKRL